MTLEYFLKQYLCERPLFLSLIRAKEAYLYQKYLPLKPPVLDVGCGDGFFASVAFGKLGFTRIDSGSSQNSKEVKTPARWRGNDLDSSDGGGVKIDIGLDVKDSRINEAKERGIYNKLVIYDGLRIPFKDNSITTVISNCVLEHIPNLAKTISEIYRVLKTGGVFLTTVMAAPWEENLFGAKIFGNVYKRWMRKKQLHLNLLSYNKWDEVFIKTRFKIKAKEGYLSAAACKLIDFCHYLSIPSLVTYKIFGKWVLIPRISDFLYPKGLLVKYLSQKVKPEQSGAIFYQLRK